MSADVSLNEEHPLALELASLRQGIVHYQHEAYRGTVQLQHHSLETATTLQRLNVVENENSYLRAELDVHRARADTGSKGSHRDSLQIQELTLALRRLSDKLDLTEKALLARNEELILAQSERDLVKNAEETALEVVVRLRLELEGSHSEQRELFNRVKTAEEQRKMSDLVVEEYASLVRSLEGRPSLYSQGSTKDNGLAPRSSLDGLKHARQGLQKLLLDSNSDSERLHAEIGRLHDALEMTQANLQAERKAAAHDKQQLALVQLELHQLKTDDNAAAKMVSRYMKFSQSSTDVLHGAIENLKARYASTISTYESRLRQLEDRLAAKIRQSEHLRRALDELTEDISRETYGRRREICLRLALLGREEILSERLKRWLLKAHEVIGRVHSTKEDEEPGAALGKILKAAEDILVAVDDNIALDGDSTSSAARVLAAEATVSVLVRELQMETDKRLFLQHQIANAQPGIVQPRIHTPKITSIDLGQYNQAPSTAAVSINSAAADSANASPGLVAATQTGTASAPSPISPSPPLNPDTLSGDLQLILRQPIEVISEGISGFPPSNLQSISAQSSKYPASLSVSSPPSRAYISDIIPLDHSIDRNSSILFSKEINENKMVPDLALSEVLQPEASVNLASGPLEEHASHRGVSFSNVSHPDTNTESNLEELLKTSLKSVVRRSTSIPEIPFIEEFPRDIGQMVTAEVEVIATVDDPIPMAVAAETLDNKSVISNPIKTPDSDFESTHTNPGNSVDMPQVDRYKTHALSLPPLRTDLLSEPDVSDNPSNGSSLSGQDSELELLSLLPKLSGTKERYDEFQRSFRDCHLALRQLKQSLEEQSSPSSTLQTAMERLYDYCEDARVELEIRVADEERISKGYQTLLLVPGAFSDEVNEGEVKKKIEAFVDGSDPAVHRAQEMMRHKLDDLQHDIASVKRARHDTPSPLLGPQDNHHHLSDPSKASSSSWSSWTGSFLSSSRSPSPAPGLSPSFGAVMTSPRLRHSSSSQRMRTDSSNSQNPFASLGLRIPMPSQVHGQAAPHQSPMSHARGMPRSRVTSNMFSVGIQGGAGLLQGVRRPSFALNYENTSRAQLETFGSSGDLDNDLD